MVYLTRVEHFNAAHRLHNPDWSVDENKDVFGKCNNENWHGHNYELHVTIKGDPHPQTGFVYNAKTLGDLIKDVIVEKVDGKWIERFGGQDIISCTLRNDLQIPIELAPECSS